MQGSLEEARVVNQYINQVKAELFEHYQLLLLKGSSHNTDLVLLI